MRVSVSLHERKWSVCWVQQERFISDGVFRRASWRRDERKSESLEGNLEKLEERG